MEKNIINQTNDEVEAIAQRMADRAGENTRAYNSIATLTVYNPSKTASDSSFTIGDIVKSWKTQSGYENEKYDNPFKGIILKVRMFLKLKYKYSEGRPGIMTNEFDSYDDEEMIVVKQQDEDGKYQKVFEGNYKDVNDKYSLKGDTEIEKKLELHHAIYVLRDLESLEVVRIDSKGISRSNLFDFMKSFSRKSLDKMSTTWTTFGTELSDTDFNGKTRREPIAGFTYTKGEFLTLDELKKADAIQAEFSKQLMERDVLFGSVKSEEAKEYPKEMPEDIPTIQLEEPEKQASLTDYKNDEEEEEVSIEKIPF